MVHGLLKADSIVIGEFTASFLRTQHELKAKAALVDSQAGHTHGWTTRAQWSKATMQKLQELRQSMEEDIAETMFVNGATSGGSAAGGQKHERLAPPTGIGEHLGDDAPQIETPE